MRSGRSRSWWSSTGVVGFLIGLPSRRLVGDYLAIVTLFFLQIWLVVVLNSQFTRGPNGISDIQPLDFFGKTGHHPGRLLLRPRGGAARRRGVPLPPEPVAHGPRVAGAPGGRARRRAHDDAGRPPEAAGVRLRRGRRRARRRDLRSAVRGPIFPSSFDPLLITVYAMVVLGGAGSIFGVIFGAVLINASLEALRDPENASCALLLGSRDRRSPWCCGPGGDSRPSPRRPSCSGSCSTRSPGKLDPSLPRARRVGGARIDELVSHWVILPEGIVTGDGLPAGTVGSTPLHRARRSRPRADARTQPALARRAPRADLYFACVVWENIMLPQPSVSRFVLIGAMLVALMAARPEGIFGKKRVEIV